MRIYVSRDDINKGIKTPTSSTQCPVARAIKRATGKSVLVGISWYVFGKKYTTEKERLLPSKAVDFINTMCFGRFSKLEPFSFSIKVV